MVAFPLIAALISAACMVVAVRRYAARRRPHELAWSLAFAFFTLGAAAEVAGDLLGWSPLLTRLYYVSGAVLTVGYLGLGSLQLLLGRRMERWLPGVMLGLGALGFAFVFSTPVDASKLDRGWQALAVKGTPTLIVTILVNSLGTLMVVGGALYSAVVGRRRGMPRERVAGLAAIALGTLVVASGGTVYRVLGDHAYLYITMAPGVAIILAGYLLANRSGATREPKTSVTPAPDLGVSAAMGASETPPASPLAIEREPAGSMVSSAAPTAMDRAESATLPSIPRSLGAADVPRLRLLLADACVTTPEIGALKFRPDAELEGFLARADSLWLGLEAEGRLIGAVAAIPGSSPLARHTARLELLTAATAGRGVNVGAALLDPVIAWADDVMGLARLHVAILAGDRAGRQLYEARGFVHEGVARRAIFVHGHHHDVLLLARVRE